jgi:hypothetical protein
MSSHVYEGLSSKVRSVGAEELFLYFVLIAAIGNVVLRTDIESDITLYRLLAPVALIFVAVKNIRFVVLCGVAFLVFALYSFILASFYSDDYSQFIPSVVHYLYALCLYVVMWRLRKIEGVRFEIYFVRFISLMLIFIFICLILELFLGFSFPNLYVKPPGDYALRSFYWNQNDLAVVLCAYFWLLLPDSRFSFSYKWLVAFGVTFVLVYNSSKSALIGFIVIVMLFSFFRFVSRLKVGGGTVLAFFAVVSVGFVFFIISVFGDDVITTGSEVYTINSLLVEPVMRILRLEPTGDYWGSVSNRTDATIFVLIEYINSLGFGLGPGGSWLVLTQPEYTLGGAKSPHNAMIQFMVDFGFVFIFLYTYLVFMACYWAIEKRGYILSKSRAVAVFSFPALGLSQSGAIITNYLFIVIVIYLFIAKKEHTRVA